MVVEEKQAEADGQQETSEWKGVIRDVQCVDRKSLLYENRRAHTDTHARTHTYGERERERERERELYQQQHQTTFK